MIRIGVLALQGDVSEHMMMLERIGVEATPIKLPGHLSGIDGLIIPGGESTTIGKLLVGYGLEAPIRDRAISGFPIWGTCAGMILMARTIVEGTASAGQPLLGAMDIRVRRNAFGRQIDSFETDISVPLFGSSPFRAVFICAPFIDSVSSNVQVIARLAEGPIVAARQEKMLVTAFHPELTGDSRFHEYFVNIVRSD